MIRIKTKLITAFISFIVLLLLINGIFLLIHFQTVDQYQKVTDSIIWSRKIPRLTTELINVYNALIKHIDNSTHLSTYQAVRQQLFRNFDQLDSVIQDEQSIVLYSGIRHMVNDIVNLFDSEIKAMSTGNIVNASIVYHEAVRRNYYVRENTANLILKEAELAEKSHKKVQTDHRRIMQLGISALLAVTISSFIFAILFSNKLTRPLTLLSKLSLSISSGQLDAKVPKQLLKRKDEIGLLSNTFHTMIDHLQMTIKQLHLTNEELVNAQGELKDTNFALQQNLEKLKFTQSQLVEAEKMASLGGLIAGVAHEINSPLGVAIMTTSHLADTSQRCFQCYEQGQLKRSEFETYLNKAIRLTIILHNNLNQAADLINQFKQLAIDQSDVGRRTFNIKTYIQQMLLSLQFEFRKQHTIHLNCNDNLQIDSYPGLFYQILTNLIQNSFMHGFQDNDQGVIEINIWESGKAIVIYYCDNGCGMPPDVLNKSLEPFYTTRRNQGGTGLGLHIVYNIIVHTLKGEFNFTSTPGQGVIYLIRIPHG